MRQVYLIGIGDGNPDLLTVRARKIIERSDCLIGAKRMLEAVQEICRPEAERTASFQNEEIARLIDRQPQGSFISVLLSGDVGFYSGAKKLCGALREMKEVSLELIPGISSLQYLCAKLETAWDDVTVVSVHGREGKVASALRQAGKVFVLTGSNQTAGQVCAALCGKAWGWRRFGWGNTSPTRRRSSPEARRRSWPGGSLTRWRRCSSPPPPPRPGVILPSGWTTRNFARRRGQANPHDQAGDPGGGGVQAAHPARILCL